MDVELVQFSFEKLLTKCENASNFERAFDFLAQRNRSKIQIAIKY